MSASAAPPKAGLQPSPANIQLMQLTNAFWTSRCLHVVAELGVADHLGDQPQSTESLAKATGTRRQSHGVPIIVTHNIVPGYVIAGTVIRLKSASIRSQCSTIKHVPVLR